jgi:type II secretory pathway pseudopilin PulG
MTERSISRHRRRPTGFTLIEMVLAFVIIGLMYLMMSPRISRFMQSQQTRRAASIVAADLERAFSMAGRYRKPMRLSCVCGSGTYTVVDRTGGTVRLSRNLRNDGDLGRMTLTFAPTTPIEIFPSGISNNALTVQVTSGSSTRSIVLTTAGQVRILP